MQLRKEAWKNSRLQRGLGAGQLRVHMFPWKKWVLKSWIFFFFQGFFTQLHELRSLRRSFPQFIYDLFHISLTIFLDRDGHLRVERWRKIMGCCFVSGKSYLSFFSLFLSYWKDHGLLRSRNFATMATWRNDFSSLLTTPHTNVIFSWKYCSLPFEWWL